MAAVPSSVAVPICLVVAASERWGIGYQGQLPWRLPGDMAAFRRVTTGTQQVNRQNAVVMGRKTWDSIPPRFRPLPGRLNIILSRLPQQVHACIASSGADLEHANSPTDVKITDSLRAAMDYLTSAEVLPTLDCIHIIGGGEVYKQALEAGLVDRVYLTRVHADPACDTFLPILGPPQFQTTYASPVLRDDASGTSFHFEVLDRVPQHPALPMKMAVESLLMGAKAP